MNHTTQAAPLPRGAPRRVGVFGGAFDPPHGAHRALAQAALEQLHLDALHITPTGHAWHKARPLTAAAHRWAMCELAFGDLPRVCLDDRELHRPGPSYTADTLQALAHEQPGAELYLVLGADQLQAFCSWSRWQDVLQLARLAVANRPMSLTALAQDQAPAADLSAIDLPFVPLHMPLQHTSSTAIRSQVRGRYPRFPELNALVPAGVARYISEHHLYETPT